MASVNKLLRETARALSQLAHLVRDYHRRGDSATSSCWTQSPQRFFSAVTIIALLVGIVIEFMLLSKPFPIWLPDIVKGLFLSPPAFFGYMCAARYRAARKQPASPGSIGQDKVIAQCFVPLLYAAAALGLSWSMLQYGFSARSLPIGEDFHVIRLASMVMTRVQHAAFYTVIALIAWFAFSFFQKARPIWIMGKAFFTIQLSLWMIHLLAGIATGFISRITSFAKPGAPHGGMRLMHFERATHDHIANSTIEFILYVLVVGLVYAAYKRRMAGERNSAKSRDQPSKPPPIPKGPDIEPEPAPPPPPIPGSR